MRGRNQYIIEKKVASKTVSIDFDNYELVSEVAGDIDITIAKIVADLPVGARVITVEINTARTHYTRPVDEGSFRDFHYDDSGLLITVVYEFSKVE